MADKLLNAITKQRQKKKKKKPSAKTSAGIKKMAEMGGKGALLGGALGGLITKSLMGAAGGALALGLGGNILGTHLGKKKFEEQTKNLSRKRKTAAQSRDRKGRHF